MFANNKLRRLSCAGYYTTISRERHKGAVDADEWACIQILKVSVLVKYRTDRCLLGLLSEGPLLRECQKKIYRSSRLRSLYSSYQTGAEI